MRVRVRPRPGPLLQALPLCCVVGSWPRQALATWLCSLLIQSRFLQYVRVSQDTPSSVIYQLMTQHWGLDIPNLLISVTGGAKNFNMKPRLKSLFRRGLVKVAQTTGTVEGAGLQGAPRPHPPPHTEGVLCVVSFYLRTRHGSPARPLVS